MKKIMFIILAFACWACYQDQPVEQPEEKKVEVTKTYKINYQQMALSQGCYYQGGIPGDGTEYETGEIAYLKYPDDCVTGGTCNCKMICVKNTVITAWKFAYWSNPYPIYDNFITIEDHDETIFANYERE